MRHSAGIFSVVLASCLPAMAQSACVNFPAEVIPLSSIAYVIAANSAGDRMVVGALTNGLNTLAVIPPSTATNQLFCDASIQLAAQQFYPSVYVPSAAERSGNFSAFSGLLVDPASNQAFPGGVIPTNRLGAVFAFRIGPVQTSNSSRNWNSTGLLTEQHVSGVAVLLPSGKVLVVGNGRTADLYDPSIGIFTPAVGRFAGLR